jgi:PEP-CTERM motif
LAASGIVLGGVFAFLAIGEYDMLKKALLVSAAMVAAAAFAPSAAFAGVIASGSSTSVAPSGYSPVIDFTSPFTGKVDVTITDCCITGDYYKTWVDGVVVGTTPIVPVEGPTLSSGTFSALVTAGTDTLQVQDLLSLTLTTFPNGASVLPAGFSYSIATPEPSTWAMMLLGFAGLGFAAYRKARPAVSVA